MTPNLLSIQDLNVTFRRDCVAAGESPGISRVEPTQVAASAAGTVERLGAGVWVGAGVGRTPLGDGRLSAIAPIAATATTTAAAAANWKFFMVRNLVRWARRRCGTCSIRSKTPRYSRSGISDGPSA